MKNVFTDKKIIDQSGRVNLLEDAKEPTWEVSVIKLLDIPRRAAKPTGEVKNTS